VAAAAASRIDAMTIWDDILARVRPTMAEEDFRRWFGATAYASDSGDQITVWVPSEAIRRHLVLHYDDCVRDVLRAMDRPDTQVRFLVGGTDEDDDDS
jgi:chromosomal replication initiation ATPase DnaA